MSQHPASEETSQSTEEKAEELSAQAPPSRITAWQRAWLYGALAMEFTAGVVGGGLLGFYLDRWQGTSPLWTLVLLVVGSAGGLTLLVRGLTQLESK